MRGYLVEGRDRLERALALPDAKKSPDVRLLALEAVGGIAYWQGDGLSAQRYYLESLDLARAMGSLPAEANAHYNASFAFMYDPDQPTPEKARDHALRALEIYRRIGDRAGEARTLWGLSNTYWSAGDFSDEGAKFAREALAAFREVDDRFQIGWASYTLALFELQRRDLEGARPGLAESLEIFADAGDVSGYVLVIDAVALLASLVGDQAAAARLSGAVAELERRTGTGLNPINREVMGWHPEQLETYAQTAEEWTAGTRLTSAEAVDEARRFLQGFRAGSPTTEATPAG
jgi:tetratricopeptide (TPR) repeat protein